MKKANPWTESGRVILASHYVPDGRDNSLVIPLPTGGYTVTEAADAEGTPIDGEKFQPCRSVSTAGTALRRSGAGCRRAAGGGGVRTTACRTGNTLRAVVQSQLPGSEDRAIRAAAPAERFRQFRRRLRPV
ncbi:MAG: hypothetical protein ACLVD8_27425 [Enterocloster sp.]|uniref:hypothetical protein n=1 Tax=Enterocloster sp. TaxID=2719315 RepID=UPI00399C005D